MAFRALHRLRINGDDSRPDVLYRRDNRRYAFYAECILIELLKRGVLYHNDALYHLIGTRRCHPAQTSAEGLFRQNLGIGGKGPERHYRRDVLDIPSFAEHQHGDDAGVRVFVAIQFTAEAAELLQLCGVHLSFIFDEFAAPVDFPFQVGVQVERFAVEFRELCVCIENLRYFIGGVGALAHDEEQRLFAYLFPFGTAPLPPFVSGDEVFAILFGSVVGGGLLQVRAPDDRHFYDAGIHCLA